MKIAYILPSLSNTGPTIVINTLVNNLIDKVERIDVFYFDEVSSIYFPCSTSKIDFNIPIDFDTYDVIHSSMYRPDKYVAKWKGNIKKAKLITTIHQDIFQNLRYNYGYFIAFIFTNVWRKHLKKFDKLVLISNTLLKQYSKLYDSQVIYNGVDIKLDYSTRRKDVVEKINNFKKDNRKIIGTYASINKGKGLDQLIKLLEFRKDFGLMIIGDGKEKDRLRKDVYKRGLENRVLFLPYLKYPYNYLENVDLYVMPSRNEGFGLAMIEAVLAGKPILCSDIPVFREIFDDSQAVFFKLEDIQSLDYSVDKAFSMRDILIKNSYQKVSNNFTANIMAIKYLNLYNILLNNDNNINCNL